MLNLIALASGVLFGIGLAISGMTDPAKVQGFLDLFGAWDPSLAFVMGGALLVTVPAFHFILKKPASLTGRPFLLPQKTSVDPRLAVGSIIFGIGWGIGGFCPGPALAGLSTGRLDVMIFVLSMVAGMLIFRFIPAQK